MPLRHFTFAETPAFDEVIKRLLRARGLMSSE